MYVYLSTDGVNPWQGSTYSMWPLVFKVLNLPKHLASRTDYLLLAGVINGPTAPKNLTPYMTLIVDELLDGFIGLESKHPMHPGKTPQIR